MSVADQRPSADAAIQHRRWDKATSRAIGEELRRTREARGWSRAQLVTRLPSGIGDRTLLSYEHGTRHLTALRLIELCQALGTDAPSLLARALQRARLLLDTLPLKVDLYALVMDESGSFPSLLQWAHNALSEHPTGVAEVEPSVVRNLALFMGCTNLQLANYLAQFLPDEEVADEITAL